MSIATISCLSRFTCFLVVALIAALLSNTVDADYNPLGGFEYREPPTYFDDAPARFIRVQPNHTDPSEPLIKCYCDLPECLAANDGLPYCHTRQGCFFRVQTSVSELTGPSQVADPTNTTITTGQPLPEKSNEELVTPNTINGAYGCLDLLPTNQTCREILKLSNGSEFPALPSANSSETVYAYHCCQNNMCNDRANQEARDVLEALRKTFQSSFQQSLSKRAAEADSEAIGLAPYTITDEKTVPVYPDAVLMHPKIATDINAEAKVPTINIEDTKQEIGASIKPTIKKCSEEPVMCRKLQNAASANHSKTLRRNVQIKASEESFKVMQWMASVMFRNFEKTAPTEITKIPNTMQFPSTTSKDESSQHNKPIFIAPAEFPINSKYPPIYHRKTNFSIADFIKIINVVRSLKPKANGFPGRHSDMNDDKIVHAGTNADVAGTTAF